MEGRLLDRLRDVQRKYQKSVRETEEEISEQKYPGLSEPALVHPHNTSIVKIRDSGIIDVFVATDNGIRINPKSKSIDFFSENTSSRAIKETKHIFRDSDQIINNNWSVKVRGETTLDLGKAFYLNSEKIVIQDEEIYFPSLIKEVEALREDITSLESSVDSINHKLDEK